MAKKQLLEIIQDLFNFWHAETLMVSGMAIL